MHDNSSVQSFAASTHSPAILEPFQGRSLFLGCGLGLLLAINAYALPDESSTTNAAKETVILEQTITDAAADAGDSAESTAPVVIKSIKRIEKGDRASKKPVAWLGIYTDEASEALAAQLGLEDGSGLLVVDVSTNSPASQAGLRRHDVLVKFENQLMVHPAQLRKLVQSRKPGDSVSIVYYRGGKEQTAKVTLGKPPEGFLPGKIDEIWSDLIVRKGEPYWRSFQENLPDKEAYRKQLDKIKEAMGNIKIDQKKIQEQINRSLNGARKGLQEALRHMTNAEGALEPARRALEELSKTHINILPDANVTVSTRSKTAHSVVKTDDSGTYVIVAAPNKKLSVHSPEGKLIFEGDIETPEQQSKVPEEIWERVEPLLDRLPTP